MTSIANLIDELKFDVQFQSTPRAITDEEYISIVTRGIRKLYVDTGRSDEYVSIGYTTDDEYNLYFQADLTPVETEYVLIIAKKLFYETVQSSVNTMVSYSTNALTVTQGDKPYANIANTLDKLEHERIITYYKMIPYTMSAEG